MYILGHFGLGYIVYKIIQRPLSLRANIPVLLFFSLLPDVDLFIPNIIHRGPTHSLVAITGLLMVTLLFKKLLPYLAAYVSHVVADLITGPGVQLFWPYITRFYLLSFTLRGVELLLVELGVFTLALAVFFGTEDYRLTKNRGSPS